MIPYPHINPEIVRLGPVAVRWYGVMYLLGFGSSYALVAYQVKKNNLPFDKEFLDSLYASLVIGLIVGARLGYVLFYNPAYYMRHPLEIAAMWQGGMSFHGGLIGSVLAGTRRCRRSGRDPWQVADLIVTTAPIGLGLGRLGNFINGELFGRVSTVPWAMVYPTGGPLPRHPSELYEFFLEGAVLFTILWIVKSRMRASGTLTALFLILYGTFRFLAEFFREPDPQLGFILGPFTMGQVLSVAMGGIGMFLVLVRSRPYASGASKPTSRP